MLRNSVSFFIKNKNKERKPEVCGTQKLTQEIWCGG